MADPIAAHTDHPYRAGAGGQHGGAMVEVDHHVGKLARREIDDIEGMVVPAGNPSLAVGERHRPAHARKRDAFGCLVRAWIDAD